VDGDLDLPIRHGVEADVLDRHDRLAVVIEPARRAHASRNRSRADIGAECAGQPTVDPSSIHGQRSRLQRPEGAPMSDPICHPAGQHDQRRQQVEQPHDDGGRGAVAVDPQHMDAADGTGRVLSWRARHATDECIHAAIEPFNRWTRCLIQPSRNPSPILVPGRKRTVRLSHGTGDAGRPS
jgi:hypothetical protein